MWFLKKLDLPPENGGMTFPVLLPAELSPLDNYLEPGCGLDALGAAGARPIGV